MQIAKKKSSLFLLYLAIFVNGLGFGIIFPLLPFYAKSFQASEITIGILASSFAISQFLFSPFWGRLSDRYGRKPIIAISLLGLAVSFFSFALAKNLVFLFISRFFQGIFSAAGMPTAQAYVADVTKKEERTKALGRLGAAISLGFILGPAFGGFLSKNGFPLPFLMAALISFLNFIFVLFLLPEVISQKSEMLAIKQGLFNFKQIWQGFKSSLLPYFVMASLWSYGLSNNQVAIPLSAMEKLKLSPASIGWLFTFMGSTSVITQGLFLGKISQKFTELKIAKTGLMFMALALFFMAFSNSFLFLAITIIILAVGSALLRPTLQSLVSKLGQEKQGLNMGALTSFEAIGRILGPLTAGFLFQNFQGYGPFWTASFLIILFLFFWKQKGRGF